MDPQQQTNFDRDDVLRMTEGSFFVPGSPMLPSEPMLMIDRITSVDTDGGEHGKGVVLGELDVTPESWYFQCHFKGDPVMPGCLGLDGMWQLLGFYMAWRGHVGKARALGVGQLKFFGQVLPHNKCVGYRIEIRRVVEREKLKMVVADGEMQIDGEPAYSAKDLRVGIF